MPRPVGGGDLKVDTDPPLRQLARVLRQADAELAKELGAINKRFGTVVVARAQGELASLGGVHAAAAAKALKPSAARGGVNIATVASARVPFGLAAVWGAQKRTGWNAGNTTANLPPWVGNQWAAGERKGKPYGLGDAVNRELDPLIDAYFTAVDDLLDRAFTGRRTAA